MYKKIAWLNISENGNLTINFPKNEVREMNGTHEIVITLFDEAGNRERYVIKYDVSTEQ